MYSRSLHLAPQPWPPSVRHSASQICRFQITVEALKEKLWKKTGTAVSSMRLELRDETGARVTDLDRDAAPLGAFSPYDGYRLHIVDLDPTSVSSGGSLEDTSLVEKYTISDESYDKLGTNF